jgi:hypothetical protein
MALGAPDAGTVRDVLMDQLEDQLSASGRSMIIERYFSGGVAAYDFYTSFTVC